jgi:glycosyltransferase involved in cell wall biosynthesis
VPEPSELPELSICIPTHHGRATELGVALDGILAELSGHDSLAGRVEVCISDNASADGTEALIRQRQERTPGVIAYRRNAENLGVGRNFLQVVELARGRWVWLLGSDDAIEPGAVRALLDRLATHPEVAGASVGRRFYEPDLRRPAVAVDTEPPPIADPTVLAGDRLLDALGLYAMYMSTQIVRRSEWVAARARLGDETLVGSLYPHTWIIVSTWMAGRSWLWEPRTTVRTRLGNAEFGAGDYPSLDALLARAVDDQRRLWSAFLDRRRRHKQLDRLHQQVLPAGELSYVVFRHFAGPRPDRRAGLAFLRACTAAFWWRGRFWRESLPVLLRVVCGRPASEADRARARSLLHDARLRVADVSLPRELTPGQVLRLTVTVANDGVDDVGSPPTLPLGLTAEWTRTGDAAVAQASDRAALPGRLRPGARRRVTMMVAVPAVPGEYALRIATLIDGVGWLQNGAWPTTVDVRSAGAEEPT